MGILESFLEKVFGKVHIYINIGKSVAAEILIHEKVITVDIKNPILAIEAALEEMVRKKHVGSDKLKQLKSMGYTIKIRYKGLEFDL